MTNVMDEIGGWRHTVIVYKSTSYNDSLIVGIQI